MWDADGFLCAIVQQSDMPQVSKDLACTIFEQLLEPVTSNVPAPRSVRQAGRAAGEPAQPTAPDPAGVANQTQVRYAGDDDPSLAGLLGGGS